VGRMVVGAFSAAALGTDADMDIWQVVAGANDKLKLHYFEISTSAIAAAALNLQLVRRSTTGTGTAVTEENLDEADGAITAAMVTIVAAPGTLDTTLAAWQYEQLGSLIYQPTPEIMPVVQEGGRIALHLSTSAASETCNGYVVWEEL